MPSPNSSIFLPYAKMVHFLSNYGVLETMPTSETSLPEFAWFSSLLTLDDSA